MTVVKTVCARDCYDVCSLVVCLDNRNNIQSITGDPEHPLTRGRLCPRSAADKKRLLENRISSPFVKKHNRFIKTGWPEALDLIAANLKTTLKQRGPESILFLTYAGNTGLLANAYPQRLWNALGATQTDHALCSKSGHTGLSLHYGRSYGANPAFLEQNRLIVFWGINPAASAPHLWRLALKARKDGNTKIAVIDPIKTHSAQKADIWLQPKPASDVALAYGLLNTLIDTENTDADFLRNYTTGFAFLKKESRRWPLDRVKGTTGILTKDIQQMAEHYGLYKPSLTIVGYGLQHCANGADQVRAVSLIPAVLGMHRGFFYGNAGAYDIDTDYLKGKSLSSGRINVINQVAVADHVAKGDFKCVYVSCMNPAMTLPNQDAFRKGLRKNNVFLVVHDTHWTKTAEHAQVVLPARTFLEKEDIIIPDSHRYVSWSQRAAAPSEDSRHEIWVMRQLSDRLNLLHPRLYENEHKALRYALAHAFESGCFDDLLAGKRLKLKCRPAAQYQTPSGKIEFYSHQASANGWTPLPRQRPEPATKHAFTYLNSATPAYTHTQFQEVYGPIPAVAYLNSKDAAAHDIKSGDRLAIFNDAGSIQLTARISSRVPESVIWSPKELEGLDGNPQNRLTSSLPQEIGNGPRFNSTRVGIVKVRKE